MCYRLTGAALGARLAAHDLRRRLRDAPAAERVALLRRLDALRQQLAERPRSERRP